MYNFIFSTFYEDGFGNLMGWGIRRLYGTAMVTLAILFQLFLVLVLLRVCSETWECSVLEFLFKNFRIWFRLGLMFIIFAIAYLFYNPDRIGRVCDRYWENATRYDVWKATLLIFIPAISWELLIYGDRLIAGV